MPGRRARGLGRSGRRSPGRREEVQVGEEGDAR